MQKHRHDFVNTFDQGSIAFGISRGLDEKSLVAYLQKFTDDDLMNLLVERLTDPELMEIVDFVSRLLKRHLSDDEYHRYFLKDKGHR